MAKRISILAAFLLLALFLQSNHAALATFYSHHKNTANDSACRILCLIEQTNKTEEYATVFNIPVSTNHLSAAQVIINSSASLALFSPHYSPQFRNWIKTIVQRK